jgi:hypothetical protein
MPSTLTNAVAAGVLVLGTAVWLGGFVTIVVVTRVARRTLPPPEQVAFFKRLGREYGMVATGALLLALAGGTVLLRGRAWDAELIAAAVLAATLVVATVIGVIQARAMTRLRRSALEHSGDEAPATQVSRAARRAVLLRTLIGAVTVALVTLGVHLAA